MTASRPPAPPSPPPSAAREALERLVDDARRGEPDAERRLFRRYHRLVCHVLARRGHPADLVDDLSQEVFLRVFRGLSSFRGDGRFESWLLRIVETVHLESLRHASTAGRRADRVVSLDVVEPRAGAGAAPQRSDDLLGASTDAAGPLRRVLGRERVQAVDDTVRAMPPQMRRCMRLRFEDELSYREIADVLQVSIDVVKVQIHRGRRRLRDELTTDIPDAEDGR